MEKIVEVCLCQPTVVSLSLAAVDGDRRSLAAVDDDRSSLDAVDDDRSSAVDVVKLGQHVVHVVDYLRRDIVHGEVESVEHA